MGHRDAVDRAQAAYEVHRERLPYPARLPPTPESACRSCGRPIPGTRAGYDPWCPSCAPKQPEDAPEVEREYAFETGRRAVAEWARCYVRWRGCKSTHLEPDRVDGGKGSSKAEQVAQAAIVGGVIEAALTAEDGTAPTRGTLGALAAWAVGCLSEPDGPYTWQGAAEALGTDEDRAKKRMGALCARVYGALRERGLVPPRESDTNATTEVHVYCKGDEWACGWGAVADCLADLGMRPGGKGSTYTPRTLRRWAKERGLPVVGSPPRAEVAALREWLRTSGAAVAAEGEAA